MAQSEATNPEQPRRSRRMLAAVLIAGALAGVMFALLMPSHWLFVPSAVEHDQVEGDERAARGSYYACPMLCTRSDKPGICPVCQMTMEEFVDMGALIPLDLKKHSAVALRTEPMQRRLLAREIRTLGEFEPDETRKRVVSAWVDGRIERLYADFTGVRVEKGWHLFDLYSPPLYAAQQELISARRAAANPDLTETARREAERMVQTARDRLRLLGLAEEQVSYIEGLDEPRLTLTIPSPESGVVIERMAYQGKYVRQGESVLRIADLSRLWLMVSVHERDLSWIALGQEAQISVNALPGRALLGRVGFIDPVLDPMTRTVRVRVEVPNDDGALRPGMFGTAEIFAELGRDTTVATPPLEGDHACPMHPLQRGHSTDDHCEICGMAMTPSPPQVGGRAAAVWAVPREAVLTTGRRHMVFGQWLVEPEAEVDHAHEHGMDEDPRRKRLEEPLYQGFEVRLGPLAAEYHVRPDGARHKMREYYPLIGGFPTGIRDTDNEPGLWIVINGQFLIDSQMELTGKPSLMRPEGGAAPDPHEGH
jgi:membrane fusion protein, copper/silver efflux system